MVSEILPQLRGNINLEGKYIFRPPNRQQIPESESLDIRGPEANSRTCKGQNTLGVMAFGRKKSA